MPAAMKARIHVQHQNQRGSLEIIYHDGRIGDFGKFLG